MRTTCRIRHRPGDYLGNWGLGGEGVIITPHRAQIPVGEFSLASPFPDFLCTVATKKGPAKSASP